jgi:hypothetical protein
MASRYELLLKIATGGMATVHLGRLKRDHGFWRLVAIKRAPRRRRWRASTRDGKSSRRGAS